MQSASNQNTKMQVTSIQPRLLRVSDAVVYAATSRAKLYNEMKMGALKFIKLDSATRIEITELDRWINETAGIAA